MNKELILEALEVLRTQVEDSMDANDAHLSVFYMSRHNEISEEINKLNTITNG
tara:strand:+ start:1003 stop:1161 length:159 start_codon:yes stop_codon:yes gene_type:complete